jgi:predicted phosphodiesterase
MKIALVGDVHGDFALLEALLRRARDEQGVDLAVQVGDFGFFADRLPARPPFRLAVPLHAVCGNHEDHDYLARARRDGLLDRWAESNLFYQTRPLSCRPGRSPSGSSAARCTRHDPSSGTAGM